MPVPNRDGGEACLQEYSICRCTRHAAHVKPYLESSEGAESDSGLHVYWHAVSPVIQTRYIKGCSLRGTSLNIVPSIMLTVRPIGALGASYATLQLGHHQLVMT